MDIITGGDYINIMVGIIFITWLIRASRIYEENPD